MLQQAQKMQKEVEQAQNKLKEVVVEGYSGGQSVTVTATATKEILSLTISEALVDTEEIEVLQDLIVIAINEALNKAEDESNKVMSKFTGGMPGLF